MISYNFRSSFIVVILLALLNSGCSQNQTVAPVRYKNRDLAKSAKFYQVRRGDTLYSIGFRSGFGYQRLAEWNRIQPPYEIHIGQKIRLFKPKKTQIIYTPRKPNLKKPLKKRSTSQKKPIVSSVNKKVLKLYWQWPLKGKILKNFSQTGKKGIDIYGKPGQTVRASAAGKVVYSGDGLIGYGNLLIIKHNYLYLSAYANNRRLLVKEGELVNKGQSIAEVGTGNGKQASLHFEIRKNGKPVNPVWYLPK